MGAGTGICSRLLADRGARVLAIEPNDAMRAAAEDHPRVEWQRGTAERTGLEDSGVDLVVCAQAFHWFEPQAALQEFHRILRPGGRLALIWNKRDNSDPFTAGYRQAILDIGATCASELNKFDAACISRGGWFTPPRCLKRQTSSVSTAPASSDVP